MPNPCFCCELKTATLIVAVLDMTLAAIGAFGGLLLVGVGGSMAASDWASWKKVVDDNLGDLSFGALFGLIAALLLIYLIICAANFYLGVILKRAVVHKDINHCKVWIIATSIWFALDTIGFIATASSTTPPGIVAIFAVSMLFHIIRIWVVAEFVQELKKQNVSIMTNTGISYNDLVAHNELTQF